MTRCRGCLEKRLEVIRQENRVLSRKVTNRLLGIKKYAVLREAPRSMWPLKWRTMKVLDSREEAENFVRIYKSSFGHPPYWLIEEVE